MSDTQQGADNVIEIGRAKASSLASTDRIGHVVARYFDLISTVKRDGLGAESVNELVELLSRDREFAITRDNNVTTPIRDLVYAMVDSFGSLIDDLTTKRAVEVNMMLSQAPIDAANSSTTNTDLLYSESLFPLSPKFVPKEEEEEVQILGTVVDGVSTELSNGMDTAISYEEPSTSSQPTRVADCDAAAEAAEHRCLVCGQEFQTFAALLTHASAHNPSAQKKKRKRLGDPPEAEASEKPKYQCPLEFCQAVFNYPSALSYHMLRHTGERPHKCTRCEEGFINSADLKMHLRDKHGERPYACELCGEKFDMRAQLSQHKRSHRSD